MSFFLSMISVSFSQVGFGAIYFGFLYSSLAILVGIVFVDSDLLYALFGVSAAFALLSPTSSQVRVETRGVVDLSHADPTHLYPVLLFSNPVPGFFDFGSQLDFRLSHSYVAALSKVLRNPPLASDGADSSLGFVAE